MASGDPMSMASLMRPMFDAATTRDMNGQPAAPPMAERNERSNHVCSVCTKGFANQSSLSKHMAVHSDRRPHECLECGKKFKRFDHLSGHMATHRGEKPHACTVIGCTKSYSDPRSLKRHVEKQHPNEVKSLEGKKKSRRENMASLNPALQSNADTPASRTSSMMTEMADFLAAGPTTPMSQVAPMSEFFGTAGENGTEASTVASTFNPSPMPGMDLSLATQGRAANSPTADISMQQPFYLLTPQGLAQAQFTPSPQLNHSSAPLVNGPLSTPQQPQPLPQQQQAISASASASPIGSMHQLVTGTHTHGSINCERQGESEAANAQFSAHSTPQLGHSGPMLAARGSTDPAMLCDMQAQRTLAADYASALAVQSDLAMANSTAGGQLANQQTACTAGGQPANQQAGQSHDHGFLLPRQPAGASAHTGAASGGYGLGLDDSNLGDLGLNPVLQSLMMGGVGAADPAHANVPTAQSQPFFADQLMASMNHVESISDMLPANPAALSSLLSMGKLGQVPEYSPSHTPHNQPITAPSLSQHDSQLSMHQAQPLVQDQLASQGTATQMHPDSVNQLGQPMSMSIEQFGAAVNANLGMALGTLPAMDLNHVSQYIALAAMQQQHHAPPTPIPQAAPSIDSLGHQQQTQPHMTSHQSAQSPAQLQLSSAQKAEQSIEDYVSLAAVSQGSHLATIQSEQNQQKLQ